MKYFGKVIFVLLISGCVRGLLQGQTLPQLISENNRLQGLEGFKDTETSLHFKLASLQEINRDRRQYGLKPIMLDLFASRMANMHCMDMITHNYGGHWDSLGRKPYQQYGLSGGTDHVIENIYILQFFETVGGRETMQPAEEDKLMEYLKKAENGFMSEQPPHDGHRQQILSPIHTHVGIGYAMGQSGFRYTQEFLDRYVSMDPIKKYVMQGDEIELSGTVLNPIFGEYGAMVYYEPPVKPLPSLTKQPDRYPDFGQETYLKIPSWQTRYDIQSQRFSIPISFENAKPGLYYVIIYVRSNPETIPYHMMGNIEWHTKNAIPATSIVIDVH